MTALPPSPGGPLRGSDPLSASAGAVPFYCEIVFDCMDLTGKHSGTRTYIAIDLKSFYASVECMQREMDPLTTNLVVADTSRTEKTICLAVSPALKSFGLPGRCRLFEVNEKVREVNDERRRKNGGPLSGKSVSSVELSANPALALDYIAATPQMAKYMEISTKIYGIYLRYIAPEDIHVYSVDEVFMDVTGYLNTYKLTGRELAMKMIREVLSETGITATAGIGTNLYLAKIAMDIVAKHIPADKDGVRIAELDEETYKRELWDHRPITDFWRVGRGYAKKLAAVGIETMGDIARCSLGRPNDYYNEDLLFKLFGVNAELLIDHAWGVEPCTIADIKAYKPEVNSLGSGQVLMAPYSFEKGRVIVREMAEALSLTLVDKGLVTDQLVLDIGYDRTNLENEKIRAAYKGPVTADHYGRAVPKPAHGSLNLLNFTSSMEALGNAAVSIYDTNVNPLLFIRRVNVTAAHVIPETEAEKRESAVAENEQLNLFTDYAAREAEEAAEKEKREKERRLQEGMLSIRKKYGNNAVLRGINFEEGATGRDRNGQIGGHKA